jgi:hypothetical protein
MKASRYLLVVLNLICAALLGAGEAHAETPAITGIANAIQHATTGCDGAVVFTPQPGTQFFPLTINMPEGGQSFYAKAAQRNVKWLDTMSCIPTKSHAKISRRSQFSAASFSYLGNNWSGYQINQTAQFVQAGWVVPRVTLPSVNYANYNSNAYEYDAAVWPGIGGGYNGTLPLVQSGTDSFIDVNNTDQYYFWWQVFDGTAAGNHGNQISNLSVNYGDEVGAVTYWVPAYSYATVGTAVMGVCNYTTGWCVHYNQGSATSGWVAAPGNTTEWVIEAPADDDLDVLALAKYGTVGMRNSCWAATTNLVVTAGGTPAPVGQGGGTVNCQPITSGNSPTQLLLEQQIWNGWRARSTPGSISSNGLNFDTTYSLGL